MRIYSLVPKTESCRQTDGCWVFQVNKSKEREGWNLISYGKENKDDETSKAIHRARRGRAGVGGGGKDMEEKKWGGEGVRWRSKAPSSETWKHQGRKRKLPDSDSKRSHLCQKTATKETNYEVEVFNRMKYENNFCLI